MENSFSKERVHFRFAELIHFQIKLTLICTLGFSLNKMTESSFHPSLIIIVEPLSRTPIKKETRTPFLSQRQLLHSRTCIRTCIIMCTPSLIWALLLSHWVSSLQNFHCILNLVFFSCVNETLSSHRTTLRDPGSIQPEPQGHQ